MKYKLLGKSGLRVSELCLGTMTFGLDWKWGSDYYQSSKVFDIYKEAGGNFIDTANMYTNGTSEKYVGKFIKGDRDRWVVATKYSLNNLDSDVNLSGNHRKNMIQAVNASLSRLNLDYIDLLWLHIWDHTTPIDEVMRAFDDLIRSGKVLYIGISDAPAWVVSAANTMAELKNWTKFVALQIEYSLIERTPERDLIPMAKAFDLAITPWSPLSEGFLTGKYREQNNKGRLKADERSNLAKYGKREEAIVDAVIKIAGEINRSPSQVALNWILRQDSRMIPIIGARTPDHLKDNIGCLDFSLSDDHLKQLNQASQISHGFPNDFFNGDKVQDFAFNGALKKIEPKIHM